MTKPIDLRDLTDAELDAELARRRGAADASEGRYAVEVALPPRAERNTRPRAGRVGQRRFLEVDPDIEAAGHVVAFDRHDPDRGRQNRPHISVALTGAARHRSR